MKLVVGLGNPGKKYEGTRHNTGWLVVEQLASQMTDGQWLMVKGKKLEASREPEHLEVEQSSLQGCLEPNSVLVHRQSSIHGYHEPIFNLVHGRNWRLEKRLSAQVSGPYTLTPKPYTLILAKPTVFVNESGRVVKKLLKHFKVRPADLWVVHDDIDLPLGKIKIQIGGGAAGHHGVESIIKEIGSREFVRIRLGIGRPGEKLEVGSRRLEGKLEVGSEIIEEFVLAKFSKEEKPVVEKMVERAVRAIKFGLEEGVKSGFCGVARFN